MTLFEQCVEAAAAANAPEPADFYRITRSVLECLRDNTGSPYTVDEVTRVLGEGAVVAPYVA
jgi:hypothetical protein